MQQHTYWRRQILWIRNSLPSMVTRARDPADERRVLINRTEAAEALRDGVWSITNKIKTACQLTDDGQAKLRDTLDAFARPARD